MHLHPAQHGDTRALAPPNTLNNAFTTFNTYTSQPSTLQLRLKSQFPPSDADVTPLACRMRSNTDYTNSPDKTYTPAPAPQLRLNIFLNFFPPSEADECMRLYASTMRSVSAFLSPLSSRILVRSICGQKHREVRRYIHIYTAPESSRLTQYVQSPPA